MNYCSSVELGCTRYTQKSHAIASWWSLTRGFISPRISLSGVFTALLSVASLRKIWILASPAVLEQRKPLVMTLNRGTTFRLSVSSFWKRLFWGQKGLWKHYIGTTLRDALDRFIADIHSDFYSFLPFLDMIPLHSPDPLVLLEKNLEMAKITF